MHAEITPLLLTYNEAPNIGRTLDQLDWAKRIVVVDSGSSDGTLDIVARHPAVEVMHRAFDDHASQWNFGLSHIATDWVLSLDADYVLTDDLVAELSELAPDSQVAGFEARFIYCIAGRALRGTLYSARVVLYRRHRGEYRNEGHTQRLVLSGLVRPLAGRILHDDRKPLSRWFHSQARYAQIEADYLLTTHQNTLRRSDRVRLMAWPAPILVFFYTLLVKGCILDGWPGWLYVLQRTLAELMIAIEIVSRRLASR